MKTWRVGGGLLAVVMVVAGVAEAATIANSAGVKLLLFYHLLPAPDSFLTRRLIARGIERVRGDGWRIADDGTLISLPAGSADLRVTRIDE